MVRRAGYRTPARTNRDDPYDRQSRDSGGRDDQTTPPNRGEGWGSNEGARGWQYGTERYTVRSLRLIALVLQVIFVACLAVMKVGPQGRGGGIATLMSRRTHKFRCCNQVKASCLRPGGFERCRQEGCTIGLRSTSMDLLTMRQGHIGIE